MRIKVIDDEGAIEVARKDIIKPEPDGIRLETRIMGDLKHLGYYLPDTSRWIIGEDSEGEQVLLEVRR